MTQAWTGFEATRRATGPGLFPAGFAPTRAVDPIRAVDDAVAFVTKNQEQASDIGRQLHPFRPDYDQWMTRRAALVDLLLRLRREGR